MKRNVSWLAVTLVAIMALGVVLLAGVRSAVGRAFDLADYKAADPYYQSLALREQAGFIPGMAMALFALGENEMEYGDRNAAREYLEKAKALLVGLGATRRVEWIEQALEKLDGG